MGFLTKANTAYARTEYVAVNSLPYLKGAFIKKLSAADLVSMSLSVADKDEDTSAMDTIIAFLSKHVYDDKKQNLDAEESKAFFKAKPLGDLIKLQQEILSVSGAAVDVEDAVKK